VFLPLFMLMTILKVCKLECKKLWRTELIAVSAVTFFVAASQGYLPWYYKEVSFSRIDGIVKLTKVYGPLHVLYFVYLFAYFALMIGAIVYATRRKKVATYKQAGLLAVVVLFNIAIWLVEQFIHWEFEFLAVSYVVSGLLLLFLYGMIQDYEELLEKTKEQQRRENASVEEENLLKLTVADCPEVELLSAREQDVLQKILEDKKRKEIAEELFITENTVKKHTTSIFAKLGVASRAELFEKMNQRSL
jgi:DNA-binding CsgD family transcriptional regulator